MQWQRLALIGAALAVLSPISAIASPAAPAAAIAALEGAAAGAAPLAHPAFHGHAPRATSMYCYPRNYWWFYRPYTTAAENYPRCMPYFHYPPHAYRGRRGQGVK